MNKTKVAIVRQEEKIIKTDMGKTTSKRHRNRKDSSN